MKVFLVERVRRGYLAHNQLVRLVRGSPVHVRATVLTTLSKEKRDFSWLWVLAERRALLINRLTGTAFDPETGQAINAEPRIVDAPIKAPKLDISTSRELPVGIFSTAQV